MSHTLPSISISEELAQAFLDRPSQLSHDMQVMCESLLIDTIGLCVAARNTDYVLATHRASFEDGPCTVIGHAKAANVQAAALVNGTAIHGEDYDDTFEGGPIHAGAVVVPALLATTEKHHLNGQDLLTGMAVGSEIMCRMCAVAPKLVHKAGFHPTAVFGTIAAAAGVASALHLDSKQWVNALGIAGSMASGIIEYLAEGTWTKRMHPGWSAQAGYRAARMAQEGFTGPRTLFEGEHGFFHAFANSDGCDFQSMMSGVGEEWISSEMAFKPYACGTMAHPYIDCARSLIKDGLRIEDIDHIVCNTAEGIVHRLWEPLKAKQNPVNGYAAKFSVPFAIALGMMQDDAGLNDYEEDVIHNPAIRALANKVTYQIDPQNPYPKQFTGHVKVFLKNGKTRVAEQAFFRGGRDAPMSSVDLEAKFLANCKYGQWSESQSDMALSLVKGIFKAERVNLNSLGA
jgi:2-methylcitrate dehydratase PrpD